MYYADSTPIMAEETEAKFPKFECIISKTMEDFDSPVENYFIQRGYMMTGLARLRTIDGEWSENYDRMMKYVSDHTENLMGFSEAPSHQFLIELSLGDELEENTDEMLMKARDPVVAEVFAMSLKVRELMYWYVRNSKDPKFSESFTADKFQGLPFLRLSLVYRSVALAKGH